MGRHQLVGYAAAHVLDDDGRVEWHETEPNGQVPTYQTPAEARASRDASGADPDTWPVIELRIVPEDVSAP